MPILSFVTPAYAKGGLCFALARKDSLNRNQYMLVFARPYGMAYDRRGPTLNCAASSNEADAPGLSSSGHPMICFDCDIDLNPLRPEPKGMLNALLQAEPPVIRPTGRTRKMVDKSGGVELVHEVEILVDEDGLSHRCNKDSTRPQYLCPTCEEQSRLTRAFRWVLRRYWLGGLE
ncbi:uncharacterized protein B0H18DRAFT_443126 [Fomitopsis serialis]|uniref:uncharacterized protein n=1 Tax=Fomitopsis serialis TaxID=139415 RepID=UPI002007935E|nr:uncharacterized protein B0H18DRAFT_443126 [Neoantrodia serialis]KAH9910630.1 hypothetical protein B0H18DRAFT_443126 [Neoantrodia serialis]